jgi:hypothetical protein
MLKFKLYYVGFLAVGNSDLSGKSVSSAEFRLNVGIFLASFPANILQ